MKRTSLIMLITLLLTLAASCGGGGGGVTPPPDNGGGGTVVLKLLTYADGTQWLIAPPNTTAPSTNVSVTAGGKTTEGDSRSDGSVALKLTEKDQQSASVTYITPQGLEKTVTPALHRIAEKLTHDFLATGSAPNDMFLTTGRAYIANSMDNNVAVYEFPGFSPAGTLVLPVGASPSYLFVGDAVGFVTCNGNNTLVAFNPDDGSELWTLELDSGGAAFLGPGRLWADATHVFVPLANIAAFGSGGDETEYLPAALAVVSIVDQAEVARIVLAGLNAVDTAPVSDTELAVAQVGNLSFDEDFQPYVRTSTFIDVVDTDSLNVVRSINLGVVGGGRLLHDTTRSRLLVGSITAGRAYTINTANWIIERGTLNPIILSDKLTFVSDMLLAEGTLFVSSFNEDLVYALDPLTYDGGEWIMPEPLSLEQEELFLTGPQRLHYIASSRSLLVLEGVANRVARYLLP
jgi:hypothetical protein